MFKVTKKVKELKTSLSETGSVTAAGNPLFKAWFPYRRKRQGRPSSDEDMRAMRRGRYQKLN